MKSFGKKDAELNPFTQFDIWFKEVLKSGLIEPTAFILATAGKECKPSARTLLLKGYDDKGYTFYTNYQSKKGLELELNNNAAMLFYWPELERQIRIEGTVKKISAEESFEYFKTRPFFSRLGAWASHQSEKIESRSIIIRKVFSYMLRFHSKEIPLPPYWGGYKLEPDYFEFWQGRKNRLHDRISYKLSEGKWEIERLSP